MLGIAERRREPRHRIFKGGSISYDHATGAECTLRNISNGGACLEVEAASRIPNQFTLMIRPERTIRSCRVIWRSVTRLGVSFSPHEDLRRALDKQIAA